MIAANRIETKIAWNIHPGEILLEEIMKPYNLNPKYLAEALGVPYRGSIMLYGRGGGLLQIRP